MRSRRQGSTTRSRTSPSTGRAPSRAPPPAVDVYLFPAVVGGGVGDIDEVLAAGRHLARAGFSLILYRRRARPLPAGVDGPWDWPRHVRIPSLRPNAARALTIAPSWGVTAAPGEAGALGRPGPWAEEAAEIERTYGAERTVHVSLEEFARTLTPREETVERLREGGVRAREIPARLAHAAKAGEVDAFRAAYRRFRAFDRPNVLPLFATFRYDRPFAREYPEAVQVGPLWSGRDASPAARTGPGWVWYASPASAEAIAPAVVDGLRSSDRVPRVLVRTPRPWTRLGPTGPLQLRTEPMAAPAWRRAFRRATVRIVSGSRSLLEALELGGPFLYFNGVVGTGAVRRRHRPEKIVELLTLVRDAGWPSDLVRDLADFSAGRRVAQVVARAASAEGGWGRFPSPPRPAGFAPGFEDAGGLLVRLAQSFAGSLDPASRSVAGLRRASHR